MQTNRHTRLVLGVLISAALHVAVIAVVGARSAKPAGIKVLNLRTNLTRQPDLASPQSIKPEDALPIPASASAESLLLQTPVPIIKDQAMTRPAPDRSAPIFEIDALDSPPQLLGTLDFETEVGPDDAGFVINFRIEVTADGRAHHVEILSNWLDAQSSATLVDKLMAARYAPAKRLGLSVNAVLEGGLGEVDEKGPANAGPGTSISPQR